MTTGFLPDTVIQVHPSLACNLRCGHCYSSSGPGGGHRGLPVDVLLAALRTLRGEEYRVLSISGGEPFVYRHLPRLVAGADELGFRVNLITNGLLVTPRRLSTVPALSFVAVSLDGDEAHHDEVRASAGAFRGALAGMDVLAAAGVRFGVAMAVSRATLGDVPAVYDHCVAHGAALLSLRPLAALGRAASSTTTLTTDDLARLFLTAHLLDDLDDGLRVRTDVAPATWIAAGRAQYPTGEPPEPISRLLNPLIIDEHGTLLPFAYGVDQRFAIGSIRAVDVALDDVRRSAAAPAGLVDATFATLGAGRAPFVDWFAHLVDQSSRSGGPGREVAVTMTRRAS